MINADTLTHTCPDLPLLGPHRGTHNLPEPMLGDRVAAGWQLGEEDLLLDVRGEQEQIEELGDASPAETEAVGRGQRPARGEALRWIGSWARLRRLDEAQVRSSGWGAWLLVCLFAVWGFLRHAEVDQGGGDLASGPVQEHLVHQSVDQAVAVRRRHRLPEGGEVVEGFGHPASLGLQDIQPSKAMLDHGEAILKSRQLLPHLLQSVVEQAGGGARKRCRLGHELLTLGREGGDGPRQTGALLFQLGPIVLQALRHPGADLGSQDAARGGLVNALDNEVLDGRRWKRFGRASGATITEFPELCPTVMEPGTISSSSADMDRSKTRSCMFSEAAEK